MNRFPKVAIILLSYNKLSDTIECLKSLKRITYPNYELFLVDNCSNEDVIKNIKQKYSNFYDNLIEIAPKNLGFTGGNNFVLDELKNRKDIDFFLLLSNDTVVEPEFLTELVKTALWDERIAIVGSVIVDYYTKEIIFTNGKIDKKLKFEYKLDYLNPSKDWWETDVICGCAILLRRELFLKHSLFLDENLFLYCEEIDLCSRAKKSGLKIAVAGKSKVYHKEGQTTGGASNPINVYYDVRNRILLARKLLPLRQRIIFWFLFIPARIVRNFEWLFKGKWKLIKANYFAFSDGIRGIKGKTKRKLS